MSLTLTVRSESWPIAGRFTIARGSRTEARVVVAELSDGTHTGRGECVPYARYGETVEGVEAAISAMAGMIGAGLTRPALQGMMPPGAARNALDCAFWDLEARQTGRSVAELAGLPAPAPAVTAYTISLGTPEEMAGKAREASRRPLLKIKLGAEGDPARIRAVSSAAPDCALIVDANEGWTVETLGENLAACHAAGVQLVEQPLPAASDHALEGIDSPIPLCADESVHTREGLAELRSRYAAVNIKLDKTGGLTEALALANDADRLGFAIMIGCMVGTSLAMAPAFLLASRARFVDLDGPLLLARDRPGGLTYDDRLAYPPGRDFWG